jgi:hypothetical protein
MDWCMQSGAMWYHMPIERTADDQFFCAIEALSQAIHARGSREGAVRVRGA